MSENKLESVFTSELPQLQVLDKVLMKLFAVSVRVKLHNFWKEILQTRWC